MRNKYTLSLMGTFIPNISVDCVIFGFSNKCLNILLTKRELRDEESNKILLTAYTVQGHHVLQGENVNDAAIRVLKDKTGLEDIFLEQFYTFGNTNRLVKEHDQLWLRKKFPMVSDHVVSIGFCALVDGSKILPDMQHPETTWIPISELSKLELGFDHKEVILKALDFLRQKIRLEPIIFELLPEKFTISQMQQLYETIFGITLDRRNFKKKIGLLEYIIPLKEKQHGVPHKPATVYIFSQEVYNLTKKEKLDLIF